MRQKIKMLDIVKECKEYDSIGITGHINPDGDCVASTLGMWQFLKKVYPQKTIKVLLEQPQSVFDFIYGMDEILVMEEGVVSEEPQTQDRFDVMIVLDSVIERCGNAQAYIKLAKKVVNIDHHVSNAGQGDVFLVKPKASAAAEVVYEIITQTPEYKQLMDQELAQTLYIGIIHDTGVLQYSNTSPHTLRIVADLTEYGFDFTSIIDETFYEKNALHSKMMGMALANAELALDGKVIYAAVENETIREYGVTKKELGGIVSQLRYVTGVDVSIFLYAMQPNKFKVSLRSRNIVDVAKVCESFGGGGHVRASGCNIEGTSKEIIEKIIMEIKKQL